MVENVVCCCGVLQTCCHRPDPEKHIIEGIFEIDHSPWLSLCAAGRSVAIRIYSAEKVNPSTGKGLKSENAYLMQGKVLGREKLPIMKGKVKLPTRIIKFKLKFEVVREFGPPGAFVIENRDKHEFFLKFATLQYIIPAASDNQKFHFYCSSWVYPLYRTGIKRVFFLNKLYLPNETPPGLVELRKKELQKLRRGSKDERKPWDRIYEYDCYNDLGDPNNGRENARPVLGGSIEYPYPRRLRTGRPLCQHDHLAESQPASCFQTYVPPDERLSHEKQEELRNNFVDALVRFLTPKPNHPPRSYQEYPDLIKKIVHFFVPTAALFRRKPKPSSHQDTRSLDSVDDIYDIFAEKEVKEMEGWVKQKLEKLVPNEIFNEVVATTTKRNLVNSQLPSIIEADKYAWITRKEFGRQMLAGTNPVRIRLLEELPPSIQHWNPWLGIFLEEAIGENKAFILEHDYLLPFLNMINEKGVCAYATRTILIVPPDSTLDTLEPIVIELSLPDSNNSIVLDRFGDFLLDKPDSNSNLDVNRLDRVNDFLGAIHQHDRVDFQMVLDRFDRLDAFRWELAKIHVAANDAAYHHLVSHWLHTHAVIEPFIIATRRQLSVMHPIHKLLDPHFKDTLHINALARGIFLNAGGILESTLFTGEFSMQLSSHLYKQWKFDEQALPTDLEKRGMVVKAEKSLRDENPITAGVKLVLEDYPYAKDGTEIWEAIETWVKEYCKIFYGNHDAVRNDEELQAWWKEIRNEGHGDQKEGWYDLETVEDLVKALTTLIWITSGLHAAVNFGQYAYAGWPPNRPMLLRKFIPETDTREMDEMENDFEKFVVQMLPEKFQMAFGIAVMDLLSRHTSDEVYLGQRSPLSRHTSDEVYLGQRSPLSRHTSDEVYLGQRPQENNSEESEESKIVNKFEEFRKTLELIEKKIMERNKQYSLMNRWGDAKIPYKLLYPDTSKTKTPSKEKSGPEKMGIHGRGIPNSITI